MNDKIKAALHIGNKGRLEINLNAEKRFFREVMIRVS